MKNILVCFGGVSPEHEVSIITGLQVLENIDLTIFHPIAIYISHEGNFYLLPKLVKRTQFLKAKRKPISFGIDKKGGYVQTTGIVKDKIYVDCAYLAFHGGPGESGPIQGLFESLNIPHTGSLTEGSAIAMNKAITKEIVSAYGINVIAGTVIKSRNVSVPVQIPLKLPVIVKPAHLGSSIGVSIAKTKASLTKAVLAASQMDNEIVIEELMTDFTEYNCAVREVEGRIESSEVEKPMRKDEILSFADKYERGGKKISGGMASLSRELPAKISPKLKKEIQETARSIYEIIRAKGMIRCDFLVSKNVLYLIEVNPIPGSMSFYLWEANGISFTQQITDSIFQALNDFKNNLSLEIKYETEIVKTFVNNTNQ